MIQKQTIVAISSGEGGAVSLIRLSGVEAIEICDNFFEAKSGKKLSAVKGFSLLYGVIRESESVVDDVLVSVFRAPHSYTGENMIEISCHASRFIQNRIISLAVEYGAKVAVGGDFTMRSYANGKMDLVQAEAVADIIASDSESNHRLAMTQMRGGYSKEFSALRGELINLMSLLELELDFSEEDVEFADRSRLVDLLTHTDSRITSLINSFRQGNAIKNGVPIAIVGRPNAGKSTLLNALLCEERAMVSPIAGTTRDTIEECITISNILFRFIDTAGLHSTDDVLENLGIERTIKAIEKASLILLIVSADDGLHQILSQISALELSSWQNLVIVRNKMDLITPKLLSSNICTELGYAVIDISAKTQQGISQLKDHLSAQYSFTSNQNEVIISNVRHWELLSKAHESLQQVLLGIDNNIPSDFLAQDLRETLHYIGSITGEISSDDILHNIFKNFCIGK